MSDPQQLHVDQGAKFVLPYGCVVAMSGSGVFLHRSDRAGNSNIRLRVTQQTIGPFYYDAHCEIQATGEATYEVFDLRDITQSELNTLTTLPRGTRAVVNGGAVWTPKYWNGTAWTTNGGDGGGVEEAPEDGTPYVRQDAAWVPEVSTALGETTSTASNITLSGSTSALVTIDNDSANTVTLVTQEVDPTLEIRRPYLIRAIGDGATTFTASGSASIVMEDGKSAEIAAANAPVTAMLVDVSTWWLFGALADA